MKRKSLITAVSRPAESRIPLFLSFIALLLIILVWTISYSYGASGNADAYAMEEAVGAETNNETEVESVTMSIDLEEGGVIDVDAPTTDVKIETWQGDEVLVIVEKTKRAAHSAGKGSTTDPINIQVTRNGKDVKIQTTGAENWRQSGMDISFRIVLPERFKENREPVHTGDTMTRLTSTLWRVFHRGALNWIVR